MNQSLGATYSLSILLVVMCVVTFYRVENPRGPARGRAGSDRVDAGPRHLPDVEQSRASRVIETSAHVATPNPALLSSTSKSVTPARSSGGGAAIPVAYRQAKQSTGKKGAFARVDSGETLGDVALRVYGSSAKVDVLWKANRDQLSTPEAPLSAGMLLRTP